MLNDLERGLADQRRTRDRGVREIGAGATLILLALALAWRGSALLLGPMWLYFGAFSFMVVGFVAIVIGTSHLLRYARQRKGKPVKDEGTLGFGFRSVVAFRYLMA